MTVIETITSSLFGNTHVVQTGPKVNGEMVYVELRPVNTISIVALAVSITGFLIFMWFYISPLLRRNKPPDAEQVNPSSDQDMRRSFPYFLRRGSQRTISSDGQNNEQKREWNPYPRPSNIHIPRFPFDHGSGQLSPITPPPPAYASKPTTPSPDYQANQNVARVQDHLEQAREKLLATQGHSRPLVRSQSSSQSIPRIVISPFTIDSSRFIHGSLSSVSSGSGSVSASASASSSATNEDNSGETTDRLASAVRTTADRPLDSSAGVEPQAPSKALVCDSDQSPSRKGKVDSIVLYRGRFEPGERGGSTIATRRGAPEMILNEGWNSGVGPGDPTPF